MTWEPHKRLANHAVMVRQDGSPGWFAMIVQQYYQARFVIEEPFCNHSVPVGCVGRLSAKG